jgi:ATP-binding cassette subfamily C protein
VTAATPDAPDERPLAAWRAFASTLSRRDAFDLGLYVAFSLAAAVAGSLAAVCLVPLLQPGSWPVPVGGFLDAHGDTPTQAGLFAAATATFAVLRWLASNIGARLTANYAGELRRRVHACLIDAPLSSLADVTSAEIANVLTYNTEIVVQGFSALQQLLIAAFTATASFALVFWVSPRLMLIAPVLALFGVLAARLSSAEQARVSRAYVADMTQLFWHSEEFPRRLRHVRSFEREDAEKAAYGEISRRLGDGYRRQLELVASGRLVLELLAAAGVAGLFLLTSHGPGIAQSSAVAVCLLLGRLLPYLVSTRQSFQQLRSAAPAFALWRRYCALAAVARESAVRPSPLRAALHIGELRLAPPLADLRVERLALVPGELTVIQGDSGIGKSSLVDVLAGLVRPAGFQATVEGCALAFEDYRALVRFGAYVGQSARPWHARVGDCLRWAAPMADDETMRRALVAVGLHQRVFADGAGLATALDDASSRFSGGELQRLMLAQVLLRRPFLAVLDEAMSALHAASELELLSMLKRELPQTILLVVSHRAGVVEVADQRLNISHDMVATVSRQSLARARVPTS